MQEHAVRAVGARVHQRLVGDREDAATLLAGRLGDELLGPQPERGQRLVDHERELVAPVAGQLPERDPQPQPGVVLLELAVGDRQLGALEHRRDVDADEDGRHEPEVGERRVAPADLGVVLEHAPEAVLAARARRARSPGR